MELFYSDIIDVIIKILLEIYLSFIGMAEKNKAQVN